MLPLDDKAPMLVAHSTMEHRSIGSIAHPREPRGLMVALLLYCAAMMFFAAFHPVLEWPDAHVHLDRACQGEVAYPPKDLLAAFGQDICNFSLRSTNQGFQFFSDQSMNSDLNTFNPLWAYIVVPLLCMLILVAFVAYSGNQDLAGNPFFFAPPLAFYLSNMNIEVLGLFIVVAALFIFARHPNLALLFTIAATVVDRSHVGSFFTLALIRFFNSPGRARLLPLFVAVVFLAYGARIAGLLDILDLLTTAFSSIPVLGITAEDILFNAEVGGRGYAALLASVAGLYGSMSYRPVLWFVYYGLFFLFFAIGYRLGTTQEKKILWLSVTAALCVLIILPPLSQARYYPVLIIAMWTMAIRGARWFGISPLTFQVLFFWWTIVSIVIADMGQIAAA